MGRCSTIYPKRLGKRWCVCRDQDLLGSLISNEPRDMAALEVWLRR
jgi:hypothetical protein